MSVFSATKALYSSAKAKYFSFEARVFNFFSPLMSRKKGKDFLTKSNDFFRLWFKSNVIFGIILHKSYRVISLPIYFSYSLTIPFLFRFKKVASFFANRNTTPEKFMANAEAIHEKVEDIEDSFSFSYAGITGLIGILNFTGWTPGFLLSPFVPGCFAMLVLAGYAGHSCYTQGKPKEITEKSYAFSLAKKGAGFWASFYFQMLEVFQRKTFDYYNSIAMAIILGIFFWSRRSEKKYSKEEEAVLVASVPLDAESLVNKDEKPEPIATRNLWMKLSESSKAGWFKAATIFTFIAWCICIKNGDYFNEVDDTELPTPAVITFCITTALYFLYNLKNVKVPPGFHAFQREEAEKKTSIANAQAALMASRRPVDEIEDKEKEKDSEQEFTKSLVLA